MSATPTHVVLVDARPERRSVMRLMFDNSTVAATVVGEADNHADAIALLDQHGAELVVIDFSLPVEDGLESIAELRRRVQEMVIVVCTFTQDAPIREQAVARGADAYLVKPVSAREVMAAAGAVLPRAASARAAPVGR